MIKIENLNKFFNKGKNNEVHVIDNTTLEFANTGLVCILGESGSGKTTLLNTIGCIDTYKSGTITVDDTVMNGYSQRAAEQLRNKKYGYIFQNYYMLQDSSVGYNIELALSMYNISEEEKQERIDYVLTAVNMLKYKKRLISQLSGGQQQRIAIARALVKSPEIIFADEPTGNLDEANTMTIMSIIKKVSEECLVILVTHEKRIAEFFADRIINIKDGKIISDVENKGNHVYEKMDDANIYLKEFTQEQIPVNGININYYGTPIDKKITLDVVNENGKLFIKLPESDDIVLLTDNSETKLIDDVRPKLEISEVENYDYFLKKLEITKKPSLPFSKIVKLAFENIKMMGKRQAFMIAVFIVTSLLLVIAVTDYASAKHVNISSVVTSSPDYITVEADRSDFMTAYDYANYYESAYTQFKEHFPDVEVDLAIKRMINLSYPGIKQMNGSGGTFTGFSFVTSNHLDEDSMILGEECTKRDEIVVDKWVIDKFMNEGGFLAEVYSSYDDFIGLEVTLGTGDNMTGVITGICDTGKPAIYVDKFKLLSMSQNGIIIASIEQLQAEYPDEFGDIDLEDGECVLKDSIYKDYVAYDDVEFDEGDDYIYYTDDGYGEYNIAATIPDSYNIDLVVQDSEYDNFVYSSIIANKSFYIYNGDLEEIQDYFNSIVDPDSGFQINIYNSYQNELDTYNEDRQVSMDARNIVTVVLCVIALIILYFTMKSAAAKRMQEMTVYRLIGISKRSIYMSYIVEIIILNSFTILPTVLVASTAIMYIIDIPSLDMGMYLSYNYVFILLLAIYVVNILVSILPIRKILRLPPAQLAVKS